jgi:hypothetical protein
MMKASAVAALDRNRRGEQRRFIALKKRAHVIFDEPRLASYARSRTNEGGIRCYNRGNRVVYQRPGERVWP